MCSTFEKLYLKAFKKLKNEDRKESLAQTMSVFSGIIVTIVVIYIIIMIVVPQLINSIIRLVQILPDSTNRLIDWLEKMLSSNKVLLDNSQQLIDKAYNYIQDWLSNGLLESLENIASGLSSGVVGALVMIMNIFIGFIVAIYLLLSRKKLARQSKMIVYSIFKSKTADTIMDEVRYADKVFSGFINGKILDAVVVAVICYLGMMIFAWVNPGKVTMSATLVAVIVGIFNIIPFFGWYIGLIISALLILMVNPVQCIFFIIFDVILQQIDGNILGPKIIGNTTGISSFWVLFAILLFGNLWGFTGMLLGVPVFAIIYHAIKKLVFKGLKRRGQQKMAEDYIKDYPDKQQDGLKEDVLNAAEKLHDVYEQFESKHDEKEKEQEAKK
jgi:predicted PurR-regulated permease PerM